MKLLLDSHILFWALFRPEALSARLSAALTDAANEIFVSAISPYELEMKKAAQRLGFPDIADWKRAIAPLGAVILPVLAEHGFAAARLPRLHGDPWDRLLIGQAQIESMVLASTDADVARYNIPLIG